LTTENYFNIAVVSAPLLALLVLIIRGSCDKNINIICYSVAVASGLIMYFLDEGHPHVPGSGFMLICFELLLCFIAVSLTLMIRNLYRRKHDST